MSGYTSKREVREVTEATLRMEGRDPARYNITGIMRDAFAERGAGYGYSALGVTEWRAAVAKHRKRNVGMTLDDDEQFFWDHAGFSYRDGESEHHGHAVTAILLAEAERAARERGWEVHWSYDDGLNRSEDYYGPIWCATLYEGDTERASAGNVEIDSLAPEETPKGRVIAAQLALGAKA